MFTEDGDSFSATRRKSQNRKRRNTTMGLQIRRVSPPQQRCFHNRSFTITDRGDSSSKNARQVEESGPFGRNRSVRYTSSSGRRASTRSGTTPSRTKENTAVSDFSRLFAKEQAARPEATAASTEPIDQEAIPKIPTECLIYGYASKNSEWKVLSRYERIVAPSIICEDYSREDPNLYRSTNSPMGFNRTGIVVRDTLSKEALEKSRVYRGGKHWIKVTFDSYEAADRACSYSPIEIDACFVHCEMWSGKGPLTDVPLPKNVDAATGGLISAQKARTMGAASGRASAVAGFEQAMSTGTLPRNHTMPDTQYRQPFGAKDDIDIDQGSSPTVSSATATDLRPVSGEVAPGSSGLRSRSVPHLPSQALTDPSSQYMSRAPAVRKAVLRPISEALPPQQSYMEVVFRNVPVVNWLLGYTMPPKKDEKGLDKSGLIGDGPVLKDDGSWDGPANGWYWTLFYRVDSLFGSDFCGLKED